MYCAAANRLIIRRPVITTFPYNRDSIFHARAMSQVHKVAADGFGTGTNELYDRVRPSYQAVGLSHILSSLKNPGPYNIAELGSGTGIFTKALLANPEWTKSVKEIKAIEPSSGMRDVFAKTVNDDRAKTFDGTFDTTPVEDGWADVVIIAQAYHWCSDYEKANQEFARILKPNGTVALIWNLEDRDHAKWVADLRNRIESHEHGTPQFRLNLWRQSFSTESYERFFSAPEEQVFSYNLEATEELVVERATSKSYIAILEEETKSKVVADVQEIVRKGQEKVWIDESKGVFEYPYQTFVVISQRK